MKAIETNPFFLNYFLALNKAINSKKKVPHFYELVKRYSDINNIPIRRAYWILANSI